MPDHTFEISTTGCWVCFINRGDTKDGHYPILHRLLNYMQSRGFGVGRDPDIEKYYKIISKDHRYGRKGDLEFKADRYPAGFKLEFFQNINYKNPSGGYYDFDRYLLMPYLIKLQFRNETRYIKEFLMSLGCRETSRPVFKTTEEKVKWDFVQSPHHPQKSMEEFTLADLNGQRPRDNYGNRSRDGKTLYNGQVKYYRNNRSGRLMRGVIYHNINNMWWVILNKFSYSNVADFELFDPSPEDFAVKRVVSARLPEEYLVKRKILQDASTKELINELKRRGRTSVTIGELIAISGRR